MQKWSSDLEVSSKFCLNRFETMNKDTSAFVVMINHNEAFVGWVKTPASPAQGHHSW